MNPDDIMKSIHPDVPGIRDVSITHPRYNPLTGVMLVQVCYFQETVKRVRNWFGWPCEDVVTEHKHQTAVISRGITWSFAGDADPVPFAVYSELKKMSDQLMQLQVDGARDPAIVMDGLFERCVLMDAMAREQFWELLCDMPQFGDELKAYVRRADAVAFPARTQN